MYNTYKYIYIYIYIYIYTSKRFFLLLFFAKDSVSFLDRQIARKFISNTSSDCRSIACTLVVFSGSDFSWNFRASWGVQFLLPFAGCKKIVIYIYIYRYIDI